MSRCHNVLLLGLALAVAPNGARAGEADVEFVRVEAGPGGRYVFHVTVRHGDRGWDHYADRWEVVAPDGTVIGTRVLLHPHEQEQPFTRSLTGVEVPTGITTVTVRAHDKVHGLGGKEFVVKLPRR